MLFYFIILILNGAATWASNDPSDCKWLGEAQTEYLKQTEPEIIAGCDSKTFKVLDYYLAIDKNYVYCKPMPNATQQTIRLKGADPKTFHLVDSSHSKDKNCEYKFCEIVKCKTK